MIEFDNKGTAPRYSVIIPTYQHLDDCLIPCIESIGKTTMPRIDSGEVEVIVVANGCTPDTSEYLKTALNGKCRIVKTSDPLGYTVATNLGLGVARGEYVVLMNNDTVVLDWGMDGKWLDDLRKPFDTDPTVGITGPKKIMSEDTGRPFIIFFLAMIRRSTFYKIGYLDETFSPGSGEDIDYCMRLEKHGYKCVAVPNDSDRAADYVTDYPIYHKGEATVHTDVAGWEDKFKHRMNILKERTKNFYYATHADVTCEISTKGRYFTTLPLAIMSVINQTLKPKKLILFLDDHIENPIDLREISVYKHLFQLLLDNGINWEVVFGEGRGQVANHQKAIDLSTTEFIWRLDDDNYADSDVLSKLMSKFDDTVGAVGGSVPTPGQQLSGIYSTGIGDINAFENAQWSVGSGVIETDHLYSTFVFRRSAAKHGYCRELSVVGHREETIFTHEMKRAGWKLLIDRSAVTQHLRENSGGIRSFTDTNLWDADEKVFRNKIDTWSGNIFDDTNEPSYLVINLDCGLGDHWMFRMILDEVKQANPAFKLKLAVCYPNVFDGVDDVELISIDEGRSLLGDGFDAINVYQFCVMNNWNKSLMSAFMELYVYGRAWNG